jgi:hypothetical protein
MDVSNQILLAVGDLREDIGGLKAEVRNLNSRLDEAAKVAPRVSALEHARSRIKGMVLVLSTGAGIVGSAGYAVAKALLQ